MTEERFSVRLRSECDGVVYSFFDGDKLLDVDMIVDLLNEQQATIDILLEELVNAQQQGYVVNFLHKNEHCSLIPKELEDE